MVLLLKLLTILYQGILILIPFSSLILPSPPFSSPPLSSPLSLSFSLESPLSSRLEVNGNDKNFA